MNKTRYTTDGPFRNPEGKMDWIEGEFINDNYIVGVSDKTGNVTLVYTDDTRSVGTEVTDKATLIEYGVL